MNANDLKIELDEQKKIMLQILLAFARFCDEHDLQYFLDAGTLLGAVRHKGYIPWDDDIDVNMPRKHYDRFCELIRANNGYMADHLQVEFPETTVYPFLKISDDRAKLIEFPNKNPMEVGVYIDVFPKDGIYKLDWRSKILCETSRMCNLIHWFNTFSIYAWEKEKSKIKRGIAAIGRRLIKHPNRPLVWQTALIRRHNNKYPVERCGYVTTLVNGEFFRCAPRDCFDEAIEMDFEGYRFTAPKGYDTYLKVLYSDSYMTPPPPEKQIKHHNTHAFWASEEAKNNFYNSL